MKRISSTVSKNAAQPAEFKSSDLDDIQVLDSIKKGNARAFAHIVHKYREFLYIKIVNSVQNKDLAKDVLQDVLTKVYENIPKYEKRYTFNSWITRVTENHLVDFARKRNCKERMLKNIVSIDAGYPNTGESPAPIDIPDEMPADFDELTYEKQHEKEFSQILGFIREMDRDDQKILILFYLHKKRQREISVITGIKYGSLRVRLLRLKKKLQKLALCTGRGIVEIA